MNNNKSQIRVHDPYSDKEPTKRNSGSGNRVMSPDLPVPHEIFVRNNRKRRGLVAEIARRSGVEVEDVERWVKRDLIAGYTCGNPSSKALDGTGWAFLFRSLKGRLAELKGHRSGDVYEKGSNPEWLPTAKQKLQIGQLAGKIDMGGADLETMCKKHWGWKRPRTRRHAGWVIEALKSMVVIELQLFERAGRLDRSALSKAERSLQTDFGAATKPNQLKVGAVLWMADLVKRYGV